MKLVRHKAIDLIKLVCNCNAMISDVLNALPVTSAILKTYLVYGRWSNASIPPAIRKLSPAA